MESDGRLKGQNHDAVEKGAELSEMNNLPSLIGDSEATYDETEDNVVVSGVHHHENYTPNQRGYFFTLPDDVRKAFVRKAAVLTSCHLGLIMISSVCFYLAIGDTMAENFEDDGTPFLGGCLLALINMVLMFQNKHNYPCNLILLFLHAVYVGFVLGGCDYAFKSHLGLVVGGMIFFSVTVALFIVCFGTDISEEYGWGTVFVRAGILLVLVAVPVWIGIRSGVGTDASFVGALIFSELVLVYFCRELRLIMFSCNPDDAVFVVLSLHANVIKIVAGCAVWSCIMMGIMPAESAT